MGRPTVGGVSSRPAMLAHVVQTVSSVGPYRLTTLGRPGSSLHCRASAGGRTSPPSAISFTEVLHASDVPAGVVNVLTGSREELTEQFAAHMDVNAIVYCDGDASVDREIQLHAANNIKRVVRRTGIDWNAEKAQGPYFIRDTQEFKTTWHPVGG